MTPNVVFHYVLASFKVSYILVEAFLLFQVIKMIIQDMDFDRHCATQCPIVLHQIHNQLHRVLGFLIVQEAQSHCDKAVSSHFLLLSDLLGKSFALQDLLRYLKAPGTVLKGCWTDQWPIVLRLNFMCKGGITSRRPPMVPTSYYSSSQWTWSVMASPAIGSVLDFSAVHLGDPPFWTPWWPPSHT